MRIKVPVIYDGPAPAADAAHPILITRAAFTAFTGQISILQSGVLGSLENRDLTPTVQCQNDDLLY